MVFIPTASDAPKKAKQLMMVQSSQNYLPQLAQMTFMRSNLWSLCLLIVQYTIQKN
eukprot:m.36293 g.36293  ORF g.36293 m.36293 type:complete len:56 (-) comp9978_c0_seq4:1968-2135(-)